MLKKLLLLTWLVAVCAIGAATSGLRFDSDLWLSPDHVLEKRLDFLAEEFEDGESLVVIVPLEKKFFSTPSVFPAIEKLEKRLSLIPGVLSLRSPLSATTVFENDEGLQIRSFANALETGLTDPGQFQTLFNESPYRGKLLSEDETALAIRMRVDTRRNAVFRDQVIESAEKEIRNSQFSGILLAGDAALQSAINRTVKGELFPLLGIFTGIMAFFLYFFLRSRFQVGVLLVCLSAALAQSLATVNLLGHNFTPVSLSLPLMVAVIVIADGLHIFAIWNKENICGNANPLRSTIRKTWLPCLVTSLTSAIGFGAFSISELIPVRNFGIDSFAAIFLCYPLLVSTVWGAIWLFPRRISSSGVGKDDSGITRRVLDASSKLRTHRKKTAFVFAALSLILASTLIYARTETNFLKVLFKKSSPIAEAFDAADGKLGGSGSVEVLVDGGRAMYFQDFENFGRVKQFVGALNSKSLVNDSNSYLLPLEITHRPLANSKISKLPQNGAELAQEIFFLELSRGERGKDLVSPYLNFNSSTARIEAQTPNLSSYELDALIDFAASQASGIFPDARISITGFGAYIHRLNSYVISTQTRSFALTFALIGIVLTAVFGLRLGIAGFVSNMFPVLVSTGLLCLLKVPFDFATVLIAGVTLGLSVDDSIHFLHHYKRAGGCAGCEGAIQKSLSVVARPVVVTSLLFCTGIAVLFSSTLVLMVKFAFFTIAGIAAAMLSALLFLPSLVRLLENPNSRRNDRG